jgi:hypothetical protein
MNESQQELTGLKKRQSIGESTCLSLWPIVSKYKKAITPKNVVTGVVKQSPFTVT